MDTFEEALELGLGLDLVEFGRHGVVRFGGPWDEAAAPVLGLVGGGGNQQRGRLGGFLLGSTRIAGNTVMGVHT